MVFNNIEEISKAIRDVKKVPEWVNESRKYHKVMKALLYGDGYQDLLLAIEHIESAKKAQARKKYARSIKDISAKLLEPVSNVYSASGGSKEFVGLTDSQVKDLLTKLKDVRGGMSLEKWLETYWSKDLYNADPSGLMFLEWKDENAYPTYKSIDTIRSYVSNGQNCEYVIFEPKYITGKGVNMWRVVDDFKDYAIIEKGDSFTIDEENTFENPFAKCPARINSDKIQFGKLSRLAPIDAIIETNLELLRDRSILTIYKFLNGFSTPYRPVVICPSCRGTGKNGTESCTDCDGKGRVLTKDVTDEILLPIDLNSDKQIALPTNFAGFISPDLKIWNQYRTEIKALIAEIFETIWGTRESEEVKDQTAMGVIMNIQPMTTKLNAWSDIAESHETYFTELLANFYTSKDKATRIAVITYGRNYIIQPPEYLLEQYQKSKEKKDPVVILDRKIIEYLTSKYKNDPETLRKELIKKSIEPYVHYDIEIVNEIYGQEEAQRKGLFTDWWESLSDTNKEYNILEQEFNNWTVDKISKLKIKQNDSSSEKIQVN